MTLEGRIAVITGGGRGIGAATAGALAHAGVRVAVAARTMADVEAVAEELRAEGCEALPFRCDVTDPDEVGTLAQAVEQSLGRVDILVNNAGTATSNPFARTTLDEWNQALAVNATGTFLCTQAMIGGMVDNGWGRIVNVASTAGLEGGRYITAYSASKHAVVGFTRSLAAEMAGGGVTVNAVCPGWVDTPLTQAAIARVAARTGVDEDAALVGILAESGQRRLVEAAEVAALIVDLCCGEPVANGVTQVIDGNGE